MNLKPIVLAIAIATALTSCASIFGGKANSLVFHNNSLPSAKIYLDSEYIGDAPGKIFLPKAKIQHGSILEIKAEGYETQQYMLFRKMSTIYTIADILSGGVWLAVDFANGNIYRPNPRTFSYTLKETTTP